MIFGTKINKNINFICRNSEDFSAEFDNNFFDGRRFEQVSSSLDHLTRVFIERSDIFHRVNPDRILPTGFEGISLDDVLKWLLKESGSHQYHYRHKCMDMFIKILPECGTKETFFRQNLNIVKILAVGEGNGIAKHPDLKHLNACVEPIFVEVYKWMQLFLTTLDFYIWIFDNEIIQANNIAEFFQRTVVLHTMSYFLKSITTKDMMDLVRSIDEALINTSQLSHEAKMCNRNLENIDAIRCIILVRVVDLLTIFIKKPQMGQFLSANYEELLRINIKLIFKPQQLGFDYKSKSSLLELPKRLIGFVTSITENAPFHFRTQMKKLLVAKLMKHLNMLCQNSDKLLTESTISVLDINKLKGIDLIVSNLKHHLGLDMLAEEILSKSAEVLLKNLFDGIAEIKAGNHRPRHLKPSTKKFAMSVMRLCLKVDQFLTKIVTFSFNDEVLKVNDSCTIQYGEHFLQTFRDPIFELFTSMISETIRLFVNEMRESNDIGRFRILAILAELNEFIFHNQKEDLQLLRDTIDAFIAHWPTIIRVALDMDNSLNCVDLALINLTSHMAMISPIEWHELGQRLEKFQTWLYALLENPKNSLEIKSKGVFLLPFVTDRDDKINEKLMKVLNSIHQKHMPLKSREFAEGSLERSALVAITNKLFTALLTSHSPVIYRFIINITITDEKYILESKLQQVQTDLMKFLKKEEQEVIVNQTFDAFMNDDYGPEVRLNFVSRFLLTVMKTCEMDVMLGFMQKKMSVIWTLLDSPLNNGMRVAEQSLVKRCGAFMMIEAFFASVSKQAVNSGSFYYGGNVNNRSNGEKLTNDLIRKAIDVRTITYVVSDALGKELFRKLQCYSYRALIVMISNTKEDPILYNVALFKETTKTGFIWQNMIDVNNLNLYADWTQDFLQMPHLKEFTVSIKDLKTVTSGPTQKKYIETASIFDCSLSQSLMKTDLSYSVVFSKREALEREQQKHEQENRMKIQLESTPINDHEVMSVLVGLVYHMHGNIAKFTDNFEKDKIFDWIKSLATPLEDRRSQKNVKIFLAKLIDNCRSIFMNYAKIFLGPILSVIADRCISEKINFFVTDLVAMLLSWSHVYKPKTKDERDDACALLKFLMEEAHNDREEIFKLNLEVIKKLVETWRDALQENIPNQTLLELLQNPMEQEMQLKLRCGIQLNAVILVNDLRPWRDNEQRDMFIKAIVGSFNNSNVRVYQAAAHLLGMCLRTIIGDQELEEGDERLQIVNVITQRLERIRIKSGNDVNIFLQLLYGIQKEFPQILDKFMTLIKFNIPKAVRKIKCMYLEMFLARLEVDGENVYREIILIGTKDLLKQNEYQLLALHIVNKAVEHIKLDELQKLMEDLSPLANSPRLDVRRLLFEMMINIIEMFRNDTQFDRTKPMQIILKGFTDSDQDIQNRVTNFFSSEGELSNSFVGRFQELLSRYYDSSLEKEFLHYSSQLLLEIAVKHPSSKDQFLDKIDQTTNRDFFEIPITTKSNTHRSLPPMFIQSQQKSLLAGDGSLYDQMLRATQCTNDYQVFTPTLDPIESTQVKQTFAFKQTHNSLLFSIKPQYLDRRSKACSILAENESIAAQISEKKAGNKTDELDFLRQRIVRRDEQNRSKEYALKAIDKRNFTDARHEERLRQSREGKSVVLYRRYRLGDNPDFFFNDLAILMPLQALVKNDNVIARDIFISIFQAINDILTKVDAPENAQKEFFDSINNSVMSIMQQTKHTDPFLMATLVQMVMKSNKYLDISPDVLVNVATLNNMMVTGALFLESQIKHLLIGADEQREENVAKRQKLDEDGRKHKHWLKLIELYYKMNEYEVVAGIFTEQLNLIPEIRSQLNNAIDYEASERFVDANVIYQRLIQGNVARNANEKEFYYQSYFNCLSNLSDWREITREIRLQFHTYNEVWDKNIPFYKETLLPHLIKSELRMVLDAHIDIANGSIPHDRKRAEDDEFRIILEDWISDDAKGNYLREMFPEEIIMLYVQDQEYAQGGVEAEKALRSYADEWSSLEMLDEKLKCLKSARNIGELSNFIRTMTSEKPRYEKLYQGWKLSQPKPSDSLVHWSDLLAYRQNFLLLIDGQLRIDAVNYLADIKKSLIDVAFTQNSCDSAKFLINGLADEIRANPSDEKKYKYLVSVGKYSLMASEQKSKTPEAKIKRLCSGLRSLIEEVIGDENSKRFPKAKIESFCCASEISMKLWSVYEKCREEGNTDDCHIFRQQIISTIDAIDDDTFDVTDHLLRYTEHSLKEARKWSQKSLDQSYSNEKESELANVYLKLGQFYHHVYSNGTVTVNKIVV